MNTFELFDKIAQQKLEKLLGELKRPFPEKYVFSRHSISNFIMGVQLRNLTKSTALSNAIGSWYEQWEESILHRTNITNKVENDLENDILFTKYGVEYTESNLKDPDLVVIKFMYLYYSLADMDFHNEVGFEEDKRTIMHHIEINLLWLLWIALPVST